MSRKHNKEPKVTEAQEEAPKGSDILRVATHYGSGMANIRTIVNGLGGDLTDVTNQSQAYTIQFDRLLLLGGSDIDPAWYGEQPHGSHGTDIHRDYIEWILVRRALSQRIPIMGICRGHQFLAVAAGGSLYQDIGWEHSSLTHELVDVHPRLVAHLPGEKVNSYHHQAIKSMPKGFAVAAKSKDGLIEAIYRPGALGVQFHPEFLISDDARYWKLFAWFMAGLDQRDAPSVEYYRRSSRRKEEPAKVATPASADDLKPDALVITPKAAATEPSGKKYYESAKEWRYGQGSSGVNRLNLRPVANPSYQGSYYKPSDEDDRIQAWWEETNRNKQGTYSATSRDSTGKTIVDSWEGTGSSRVIYPGGTGWKKSTWPDDDSDTTVVRQPRLLGAIEQSIAQAKQTITSAPVLGKDANHVLRLAEKRADRDGISVDEAFEKILDEEEAADNAEIALAKAIDRAAIDEAAAAAGMETLPADPTDAEIEAAEAAYEASEAVALRVVI